MSLITLTSDIGYQDYLISVAKVKLLQQIPDATIIDVSHQVETFNYAMVAYLLRNTMVNCPQHSFHLVLFNLFEQKKSKLLLAFIKNQYIICADNGLINMLFDESPEITVGISLKSKTAYTFINIVEEMGHVVKQISKGVDVKKIGESDYDYIKINPIRPLVGENWIEGQIIFIDNYGNIIVNITREEFEKYGKNRKFQIQIRRNDYISTISENYADVQEHEKLAFFNSSGYLEIAINKGKAATMLGYTSTEREKSLGMDISRQSYYFKSIRISFT